MSSNPKDRHYWTQLRRALAEGNWTGSNPACTPNRNPISWPELFRKFNKHCKGFQDVVEIAAQTQVLGSLLGAYNSDEELDTTKEGPIYPLDSVDDCLVESGRKDDAKKGYEALQQIQVAKLDSLHFSRAFYAYALGRPEMCLAHLSEVPDISKIQQHIPEESDKQASEGASSHHHHHSFFGTGTSASSSAGSWNSYQDSSAPEIRDGRAWAFTETVRSLFLEGMSHEKLTPSSPERALASYSRAFLLLNTLTSTLSITSPPTTANGKLSLTYFTQYRELWRWVARLLWRAIVLSSRQIDIRKDQSIPGNEPSIWAWFTVYNKLSAYWPPTFLCSQRSTISVLQLRAYTLRYGLPSHPTDSKQKAQGREWLNTARIVVNDYRAILNASTTFPKAGERNTKVEDFVDLCVGVWQAAGALGENAGWLVDILWWATRLTFNCPRIFRHMTYVFDAAGETRLSRRTLRLYTQVVGKAYEAKRASATGGASTNSNENAVNGTEDSGSDVGEEDELIEEMDIETDELWVEIISYGARMLCRYAAALPGTEGIQDVRDAGTFLEKAHTRIPKKGVNTVKWKRLRAGLQLAEGVHDYVRAFKEQDPRSRPRLLTSAHGHFVQALDIYPTASAYCNIALSFARPSPFRDIDLAIEYAGKALELDSSQVRHWHLLGLLLSAVERWDAAKEILEQGAEVGESAIEEAEKTITEVDGEGYTTALQTPTATMLNGEGVEVKDFAKKPGSLTDTITDNDLTPMQSSVQPRLLLLSSHDAEIPASAMLLKPLPDRPTLSKVEAFDRALQIRMSLGALTEVLEGAEGAEIKWLEIFGWVATWMGLSDGTGTRRASVDGSVRKHESVRTESVFAPSTTDQTVSTEKRTSVASESTNESLTQEIQLLNRPLLLVSPATPTETSFQNIRQATPSISGTGSIRETEPSSLEKEKKKKKNGSTKTGRSSSLERDGKKEKNKGPGKKMQRMLKNQVHQGHARITTMTRKVVKNGKGGLRKSLSVPDFHDILKQTSYQASSIHSRRRLSSSQYSPQDTESYYGDSTPEQSTSPLPASIPLPSLRPELDGQGHKPNAKMNALVADLWLMSAATFRRLAKIEQARGAIQEAEVRGEGRPGVWVQLGLYYMVHGKHHSAKASFQKALFIEPDHVPATVHLARLHLELAEADPNSPSSRTYGVPPSSIPTTTTPDEGDRHSIPAQVDLAAGMLAHLVRGAAWDVPEAWYYLAKAYGKQDRREKERECLATALEMSKGRGVRELGQAIGWCE